MNEPFPSLCPVCKVGISFRAVRQYAAKSQTFSLYECGECRVQFWVPFQNPGAVWYEDRADNAIQEAVRPTVQRGYHKAILSLPDEDLRGKKVLDVGCGTGEFLAALQERGCEVWGVDFDRIAIEAAKIHFSLEHVFAMPLEDFFEKGNSPKFDLITCFEVIEHVDDPLNLLSSIGKRLQPQGRVFLSTPSRERAFANANAWDYPPNHLTRWSEEAIANVVRRVGFRSRLIANVDEFRILLESMQGRFQTGLVKKVARAGGSSRQIKTRIIRCLGILKAYVLFGIPAFILWVYGKLTKRKNGAMVVELSMV